MTTKQLILKTKAFNKLSIFRKEICIKWKNQLEIEHHCELIKNIGYDKWNEEFKVSTTNHSIITELIKNTKA
jgi:hypothetical protein